MGHPRYEIKVKPYIYGQKKIYSLVKYTIYRNNEKVEVNLPNWITALAHARKYKEDLFLQVKRVEILNQWTGEIITLEEAEKRAAEYKKRH